MENLPIEFNETEVVANSTLHLSYNFDIISSIEVSPKDQLDIVQKNPIQALQISLAGKTSNPNISVSMDAVTRLFTLNMAYITDLYPHMKTDPKQLSFVIEGYSIENVSKEKVLIFLPMNPTATTKNIFNPLETAIVNQNNNVQLDLNDYIPSVDINEDSYSYYQHTDDTGCLFHIVFFSNSSLGYSTALKIVANPSGYATEKVATVRRANTLALHHSNMNNEFEDNIYIDCVPVDVVNKTEEKYMQINPMTATYFTDILVLFAYMIAISLVVYGIYSFYIYYNPPVKVVKS